MSRRRPGSILGATPSTGSSSGVWTLSQAAQQIGDGNWKGYSDLQNRSVKFDSTRLVELQRTPVSAGNRRTNTISLWIKRAETSTTYFFSVADAQGVSEPSFFIGFRNDKLRIIDTNTTTHFLDSAEVFRDFSAWYHLVIAIDTTLPTAANRIKAWSNGVPLDLTDTSGGGPTFPAQNDQIVALNDTKKHSFGANRFATGTQYHNYYLAEAYFVDGEALGPENFGELDHNTGVWSPKKYTGNFGTNGFYLPLDNYTETEGFNTVLYRGTGSQQSITGMGFQPDLVWIKERTSTSSHQLQDSVRGAGTILITNSTNGEDTSSTYMNSFDSDGFSVGTSGGVNESGQNYVAWGWKAGDSNVSNTDGSITTTVRANQTYGFSIVSYTGDGNNGSTVGHGLDKAPGFIISKNRDALDSWPIYHQSTSNIGDSAQDVVYLNLTTIGSSDNIRSVNDTTFALTSWGGINGNGNKHIAYCFAEIEGYSKFGSYEGNDQADGPFIETGFKPAFVMIKSISSGSDRSWAIYDDVRDAFNPVNQDLQANSSDTEGQKSASYRIDFLENGFKLNSYSNWINMPNETFIYMAFADTRDRAYWRDQSGNANDWQPENHLSDTQQDTASDNFCTLNPLYYNPVRSNKPNLAEGNLFASNVADAMSEGTIATTTGKYYYEAVTKGDTMFGIGIPGEWGGDNPGANNKAIALHANGDIQCGGVIATSGVSFNDNNIHRIMVAYDHTANRIWFGVDGVWGQSGNPGAGTGGQAIPSSMHGYQWIPAFRITNSASDFSRVNFGQYPFYYTQPTGFETIRTGNLPRPVIGSDSDEKAGNYFDTVLYTGDETSDNHISVGFRPDLIWIKRRDGASDHSIQDSVRGFGALTKLSSSATDNENNTTSLGSTGYTDPKWGYVNSTSADGFSVNASTAGDHVNNQNTPYVAWCWKAGGSPVSNTDGSIASQVSANTDAGFSIVSYTGNDSGSATVGHGLSSIPDMVILKSRSDTSDWWVAHSGIPNNWLQLDDTQAAGSGGGGGGSIGHQNGFTTTVFDFEAGSSNMNNVNKSGSNYIAYCWHSVEGFSKFGSYNANNSSDGPFVYLGFRPAFLIIRSTTGARDWLLYDNERNVYNNTDGALQPNTSGTAYTGSVYEAIDFLSNGFKLRTNGTPNMNANSESYIYMAFAETPQKFSRSR